MRRVCKVPGDTLSNFFTSSDLSHFLGGSAACFNMLLSSVNNSVLKCCRSSWVRMFTDMVNCFMTANEMRKPIRMGLQGLRNPRKVQAGRGLQVLK